MFASGKVEEKACLVARGFHDSREGLEEKYSPKYPRNRLRLILALCALKGWVPSVIDVTTAFLQGKTIEREVYLKPPKEGLKQPMQVWQSNVTVYGPCDAQRACYETITDFFASINGRSMERESAVFLCREENRLKGFIATHVDDFLPAGGNEFELAVIAPLQYRPPIG